MDTYKVIFNPDSEGVYSISLVNDPAMKSAFLALSAAENKFEFKTVDADRQILLGAVLIPDKAVYRNQGGKEFNVTFPAETILLASQNFLKMGYQKNSTIEHDESMVLENVTFVESWIKEDETHDKSVAHGFDLPVGTWFATMKVDNKEVWDDYVKTGKVTGFSIDGFFDLEKIELTAHRENIIETMTSTEEKENNFWAKLKSIFSDGLAGKPLQLGEAQTADGNTTIYFDGDAIADDGTTQVWLKGEGADEKLPVPDGTYKTDDGFTLTVSGSIVTKKEATTEEAPAAMGEGNPAPAAPVVAKEEMTQRVFYQLATEIGKQNEAREAKLLKVIDEKFAAIDLSLTTQREPVKEKTYEEMNNFEKLKYNELNKK